jgi:peptidoglycan/xylan/chitin deacetylase (PgdA/CDA1 family)
MLLKNFLFHRVTDEKDPLWPPITPSLFESIIKSITRKYHVVPLESYLSDKSAFGNSRKRIATILFDDGYKDNIEYAAGILQKHDCPASFYVVTHSIDKCDPIWTYLVDYVFQHTQKERIELSFDFVPEALRSDRIKVAGKVGEGVKKIKPWLKKLPNRRRMQVVDSILEQCNDVESPAHLMMSWNDVRELQQAGFHIGSHTHTHPILAKIETEEEIAFELKHSAERIAAETGLTPDTISYPIGSYDERVLKVASDCGYKWGLAVEQKSFRYNDKKLMSIPRIPLYQESWWKAQLRITGIYSHVISLWS